MGKRCLRDLLLEEQLIHDEAWESKPVTSAPEVAHSPKAESTGKVSRLYGWGLELPVPCVLGVCWLVGVALIGLGAWALYLLWSLLIVIAGA
jgi:hypothetical protein